MDEAVEIADADMGCFAVKGDDQSIHSCDFFMILYVFFNDFVLMILYDFIYP